uniref:hypothetical protein n=1 Tax=Salmonella sp. s58079 TaxID=3159700 RepID=UPI003980F00D
VTLPQSTLIDSTITGATSHLHVYINRNRQTNLQQMLQNSENVAESWKSWTCSTMIEKKYCYLSFRTES